MSYNGTIFLLIAGVSRAVTHTGRRGDAVAHFVSYSCGLRVQVLVCARNRWGIRVGFGAMGDFEFPGLVVYSKGLVLRPSMSTVVRRGMSRVGTSLCGHGVRGSWCFACGLLLSGRGFFSATAEVFIGVLLTALQRVMGLGRVAFVGLGASMNPPEIPFSKNGGEGAGRSFISYGNLARDFALLSAVCWMFAGCDPTVTTTVVTLIKAVKVVVL